MIYISSKILLVEAGKKAAGVYAADFVKQGATIGLGTGSTVYWLIQELGRRVKEGLTITAVPTSTQTEQLAKDLGIKTSGLNAVDTLDLTIDGADEIDPAGQLIKGGGGALLQEKIVAAASAELIIIADDSKLVERLGKFPLPVEVIPFGYKQVQKQIADAGISGKITLRKKDGKIFITDHHHYILDCECREIPDGAGLNKALHLIPGVVETGLFIKMASRSVIGYENGKVDVIEYTR